MKVIGVINQKGGVGKTTCAINIAGGLGLKRKKVLLIDLDPQASATMALDLWSEKNVYEVFEENLSIPDAIQDTKNRYGFDFVSSDIFLSKVESKFDENLFDLLKFELEIVKGYDYCIIDNPPNLGVLTRNTFHCSDYLIIPMQTEFLAFRGLQILIEEYNKFKQKRNQKLEIMGILFTLFDTRRNLDKKTIGAILKKNYPVFKTIVNRDVELADAPRFKKTVFQYRPKGRGAESFSSVVKEILSWERIRNKKRKTTR